MRHNNNQTQGQKRGRNRNNSGRRGGGGGGNNRNSFDSNGPNVRIRGSASQIYDKYATLARDATSSGDRVLAESLYQHAEHYYRLANPAQDGQINQRRFQQSDDESETRESNNESDSDNGNSDEDSDSTESEAANNVSEDVVVIDTTPRNVDVSGESDENSTSTADQASAEDAAPVPPKRGRGRPRKTKTVREPQTPAELAEAVAEQ